MGNIVKIGEVAAALRCQVPRRKGERSDVREYSGDDPGFPGPVRFIPPDAGTPVDARIGPRSLKFLLRKHDIVIVSGGSPASIGMAALMISEPEGRIITPKNLTALRADPALIDPIWLYYRMAQADIRKRLADSAAGKRSMYLPVDAISDLEIRMPDAAEIESVRAIHSIFMEGFRASSARIEKERREWEKLMRVMKLDG